MSLSRSCRCCTACRNSRNSSPTLSCLSSAASLVFKIARATRNNTLGPSCSSASQTRAAVCSSSAQSRDLPTKDRQAQYTNRQHRIQRQALPVHKVFRLGNSVSQDGCQVHSMHVHADIVLCRCSIHNRCNTNGALHGPAVLLMTWSAASPNKHFFCKFGRLQLQCYFSQTLDACHCAPTVKHSWQKCSMQHGCEQELNL